MKQKDKIYSIYSTAQKGFDLTFKVLYMTNNLSEALEVFKTHKLKAKEDERVFFTDKPFNFQEDKHPELVKRVAQFEKQYHPFMTMANVFCH